MSQDPNTPAEPPGTPQKDLQTILDALARGIVVVIGAAAITVVAFLADYAAVKWTH